MNSMSAFNFPDVDISHFDDKMELATSPFRQPDDIDLDLDPMRDASVEPFHDRMTDDPHNESPYNNSNDHDHMQHENDDDMLDEDLDYEAPDPQTLDSHLDNHETEMAQDEDIIYEDDKELEDIADEDLNIHDQITEYQQHSESMKTHATQETVVSGQFGQDDVQDGGDGSDDFDTRSQIDTVSHTEETDQHNELQDVTTSTQGQDPAAQANASTTSQAQNRTSDDNQNNVKDQQQQTADAAEGVLAAGVSAQDWAHETIPEQSLNHPVDDEGGKQEPDEESYSDAAKIESEGNAETAPLRRVSTTSTPDLHPINVVYLGEEMSLFPPSRDDKSTTYFLADASLAFQDLEKLLTACREILSGSIGHDDELVLDITALGLHICEDSKYAAQITLAQIVEVYLSLTRNDGAEEIQPLYCHLSSRVCLASQYAYLTEAVRDGKTYSEIAADYIDSPDAGSEHDEFIGDISRGVPDSIPGAQDDSVVAVANDVPDVSDTRADASAEVADHAGASDSNQPQEIESSVVSSHVAPENAEAEDNDNHVQELLPIEESVVKEHEAIAASREGKSPSNIHPDEDIDRTYEEDDAGDTASSHTVEAETGILTKVDDLDDSNHTEAEVEGQDLGDEDELDIADEVEDLLDDAEDLFDQPPDEDGLPELTETADDSEADINNDGQSFSHSARTSLTSVAKTTGGAANMVSSENIPTDTTVADDEKSKILSMPKTPSKSAATKRRIEDDDDYGLLDASTPEPKRSRAS